MKLSRFVNMMLRHGPGHGWIGIRQAIEQLEGILPLNLSDCRRMRFARPGKDSDKVPESVIDLIIAEDGAQ